MSTPEQADRELSLPAQRCAIEAYARRQGVTLAREYVDAGFSGTRATRPAFRAMLEEVLRPGSNVGAIVVNHTSRFTRDATEARVVKSRLRRLGVRVLSVCQEIAEDPMGKLMEGVFECIDQYESEINGARTSTAMREAVRQGYFPGGKAPMGYRLEAVELRPGRSRQLMVPDESQVPIVREVFRLYIALNGAKAVARELNQRGLPYRTGVPWTKDLVLNVIDEGAIIGTYWWGRRRGNRLRPRDEWVPLKVEPIIDRQVFDLAKRLRSMREPTRVPGRAGSRPHVLTGLIRCGNCGSSYQLETSGKKVAGVAYGYCYYNCRSFCRSGKEVCAGYRIPTDRLDAAVLDHITDAVCRDDRVEQLRRVAERHGLVASSKEIADGWRRLIATDMTVARTYALHLIERIEVRGPEVTVVGKAPAAPFTRERTARFDGPAADL